MTNKITSWVREHKHSTLEAYFRNRNIYKTKEEFEKHIMAIFIYANQPNPDDPSTIISFNYEITRELIVKNKKYYSNDNEYKEFLITTLTHYSKDYLFNSLFLAEEIGKSTSSIEMLGKFPLNKNEIIALNLEFLRKYLSLSRELKVQAFWMYHACDNKNGNKNDEAAQLIIDFATQKDMKNFLRFMVSHDSREQDIFRLSELVKMMFYSLEQFEEFLRKNKSTEEYFLEFESFLEKLKNDNIEGCIEFPFYKLQVNRWKTYSSSL